MEHTPCWRGGTGTGSSFRGFCLFRWIPTLWTSVTCRWAPLQVLGLLCRNHPDWGCLTPRNFGNWHDGGGESFRLTLLFPRKCETCISFLKTYFVHISSLTCACTSWMVGADQCCSPGLQPLGTGDKASSWRWWSLSAGKCSSADSVVLMELTGL